MLKQSVSLKLLLLLLVLSLGLSLFAVAVTAGRSPIDAEDAISTGTEDATTETDTEEAVDPSVIFSHKSDNAQGYMRQTTDGSNGIRFYIGKVALKPNTTYKISWKCADEISNVFMELSLGFMYVYDGTTKEYTLMNNDVDYLWESSVEFTTPNASADTVDFYFRVAEGTYEEDDKPGYEYTELILNSVQLWVREVTEGG